MIDSNNPDIMRENIKEISSESSLASSGVLEINGLIGSEPLPGSKTTITGVLNELYGMSTGGAVANAKPFELPEDATGGILRYAIIGTLDDDVYQADTNIMLVWGSGLTGITGTSHTLVNFNDYADKFTVALYDFSIGFQTNGSVIKTSYDETSNTFNAQSGWPERFLAIFHVSGPVPVSTE